MIISGMEQLRCSPPLISPPVRSSDNACGVTASGVSALPAHHRSADAQNPRSHLILDNYATHKHDQVKLWLDKHPRFHLHFTRPRRHGSISSSASSAWSPKSRGVFHLA